MQERRGQSVFSEQHDGKQERGSVPVVHMSCPHSPVASAAVRDLAVPSPPEV